MTIKENPITIQCGKCGHQRKYVMYGENERHTKSSCIRYLAEKIEELEEKLELVLSLVKK